jgi:hypothetical protein
MPVYDPVDSSLAMLNKRNACRVAENCSQSSSSKQGRKAHLKTAVAKLQREMVIVHHEMALFI